MAKQEAKQAPKPPIAGPSDEMLAERLTSVINRLRRPGTVGHLERQLAEVTAVAKALRDRQAPDGE